MPTHKKTDIRPVMEACGIDVYKTVRLARFEIDTRMETYTITHKYFIGEYYASGTGEKLFSKARVISSRLYSRYNYG